MAAPLSLFLTRFSAPPPNVFLAVEPSAPQPTVTLTEAELDARLAAAARAAASEAEHRHATDIAAVAAAHEAALQDAIATARVEWADAEGARFAALVESRFADLSRTFADQAAAVLRPWLADVARASTMQALTNALDRLLADPKKPMLRVCGPADLLDVLRKARPAAAIEWVVAETTDVIVTAEATRLQTCLASALTAIAATET